MHSSTTNSRDLSLAWELFLLLVVFLPAAWADNAVCEPGWEWASNSKGQNPCQIAGYLQAPCLGYSSYELGPLKPGSLYVVPQKNDTKGLKCGCNTIIYSLYSACEACQNASTRAWDQWDQNCDDVYVAQYPFDTPSTTAIPRWAFINITEEGSFDPTAAQNVGRDPEALGNVPVTLNLSSTSSSGRPSTSPPLVRLSSSPAPSSTTGSGVNGAASNGEDVPAIVGGVIGGVVGLASLSLLLFWLYLRRRSRGAPPYDTTRPFSHRTLSVRSRGSYYPPSVPVYNYLPESEKSGWYVPEVYSRSSVPPHEDLTHSPTEFDAQTTYNSPLYPSRREPSVPLRF